MPDSGFRGERDVLLWLSFSVELWWLSMPVTNQLYVQDKWRHKPKTKNPKLVRWISSLPKPQTFHWKKQDLSCQKDTLKLFRFRSNNPPSQGKEMLWPSECSSVQSDVLEYVLHVFAEMCPCLDTKGGPLLHLSPVVRSLWHRTGDQVSAPLQRAPMPECSEMSHL